MIDCAVRFIGTILLLVYGMYNGACFQLQLGYHVIGSSWPRAGKSLAPAVVDPSSLFRYLVFWSLVRLIYAHARVRFQGDICALGGSVDVSSGRAGVIGTVSSRCRPPSTLSFVVSKGTKPEIIQVRNVW